MLKHEKRMEASVTTEKSEGFNPEDREMLAWFKREVTSKSNIKLITL
jgi:hypothetical protein